MTSPSECPNDTCPNDTNGDGDCAKCHKCGGCDKFRQLERIHEIAFEIRSMAGRGYMASSKPVECASSDRFDKIQQLAHSIIKDTLDQIFSANENQQPDDLIDSSWLLSLGFTEIPGKRYALPKVVLVCDSGQWIVYSNGSSHWHHLTEVSTKKEVIDLLKALKLNR